MRWFHIYLVFLTVMVFALPAPAGIIFGKKNKPNPTQRVPELIVTVKTDKDESKRAAAAEELREYDPAGFKDIVPVLIDVLLNDPKASVRSEAADSLGKIRPVTQEAGWALEQALAKDSSMRVRLQARYALLSFYWHGYHGTKGKEVQVIPSKEGPPLLPPGPVAGTKSLAPPAPAPTPAPASPTPATRKSLWPFSFSRSRPEPTNLPNESAPPPLAEGKVPFSRPLPQGPTTPTSAPLTPVEVPHLKSPPAPQADKGPELNPPPG
jgi:hypothetical protein